MVNPRLAETPRPVIFKSEPETKKCSDLRDPLESSARFQDLGRICRDSHFSEDHSPPLTRTDPRDCVSILQVYNYCNCEANEYKTLLSVCTDCIL